MLTADTPQTAVPSTVSLTYNPIGAGLHSVPTFCKSMVRVMENEMKRGQLREARDFCNCFRLAVKHSVVIFCGEIDIVSARYVVLTTRDSLAHAGYASYFSLSYHYSTTAQRKATTNISRLSPKPKLEHGARR